MTTIRNHIRVLPSNLQDPTGYTPAQVVHGYGVDRLRPLNGSGSRIAIVDAYGSPTIISDLAAFCAKFGLPVPAFTIVGQDGGPPPPPSSDPIEQAGWAVEQALDTQWASVIAPGAKLLLVQCNSSSADDMMAGVKWAGQNVDVVSMSWGSGEDPILSAYDPIFAASSATLVASSGDSPPVSWPSSHPAVLAIGGTAVYLLPPAGSYMMELPWVESGGGPSGIYLGRTTPDVAFLGDPATGVPVLYNGGWYQVGGTSVGSPAWSGILALRKQAGLPIGRGSILDLPPKAFRFGVGGNTGFGSPRCARLGVLPTKEERYIDDLYSELLGRLPDAGGKAFYLDQLHHGASPQAIVSHFSAAMERYHYIVRGAYWQRLVREPDAGGLTYWVNRLTGGSLPLAVAQGLASSPEAMQPGPAGHEAVYSSYLWSLHRTPPGFNDYAYWLGEVWRQGIAAAPANMFRVVGEIGGGAEARQVLVRFLYRMWLGREASSEEADYWASGSLNEIELLEAIAGATEAVN